MTADAGETGESGGAAGDTDLVVREARPGDADAVAAFTRDTWGERYTDYVPRVFAEWAGSDAPDRGTFVAVAPPAAVDTEDIDGRERDDTLVTGGGDGASAAGESEAVVGCIQGVLLSEWEAWAQGIRVDPAARDHGVGTALATAALEWARERGATACRNMTFSWNIMGLGQSRAVGFEPATEFRFAEPEPDAAATAESEVAGRPDSETRTRSRVDDPDPNAAWAFWTDSDARDHLRGLELDPGESWACSELTRDRLAAAAAEGRLIAVADDALAGVTVRTRVADRPGESDGDAERIAEYGVAAWRDADAAGALYDAVAADAASAGADAARVLIPETAEHVSDTGANRVAVAAEPDFVMRADLTGSGGGT
ncbi:GNAT family N-acetyltransferase [Halorubrum pallidum]